MGVLSDGRTIPLCIYSTSSGRKRKTRGFFSSSSSYITFFLRRLKCWLLQLKFPTPLLLLLVRPKVAFCIQSNKTVSNFIHSSGAARGEREREEAAAELRSGVGGQNSTLRRRRLSKLGRAGGRPTCLLPHLTVSKRRRLSYLERASQPASHPSWLRPPPPKAPLTAPP